MRLWRFCLVRPKLLQPDRVAGREIGAHVNMPGAEGHAIPFIALEDGKFNVTPEAAEFLQSIDYPVSVIAVVGLYRTGKSFLMNRILL